MAHNPVLVIPGDDPPQIADSPQLKRLEPHASVRLHHDRPSSDDDKLARVANAEMILNSRGAVKWPEHVLRQLPGLRLIATCSIGVDNIDLACCRERGITVCNVPGRTAPFVAEHAFALMLATARRLACMTGRLKSGRWEPEMAMSLIGKTLGVIGTGSIGCEMIRLAQAIGMHVIAWSFHPSDEKSQRFNFRYVERNELLRTADVVSLHCRLSSDSRGLIGCREFELMKPGSLLINTARAAIVDAPALLAALDSGHLGGAGLDVYETEPLPADAPLLNCEHVVLTPHAADQTPEAMDTLNTGAVDNVLAFLAGNPQNVVVPHY